MIKKVLFIILGLSFVLVHWQQGWAQSGTLQFTSTPVTEVLENVPYYYKISATDGTNASLTFSAPTLPAWLSLTFGENTAAPLGGTVINPAGITNDANDNIYVTSLNETTIYKIQPDGTTTPWFTRNTGRVYALQVYQDYLYISYIDRNKITRVNLNDPLSGETDVITEVNQPLSITIRDNFLYAALYGDGKIIKIDPTTNTYTDFVSVSNPFGLGFNKSGMLYIASYNTGKILQYDGFTVSEVLTGLTDPSDVKIDNNNNLYVSFNGGGVLKYIPDLSSSTQVSANTSVWAMSLTSSGNLVFGDNVGNKVLKLDTGPFLSGTPQHAYVGTHPVTLGVTNGIQTVEQTFTITVRDVTAPAITITSNQASPAKEAFAVTFSFSEEVNGFGPEDITVANAVISNLQTQDSITFTATVAPPANGEVSLQINAGAVKDINGNDNTASNVFSLIYDATAPTVILSSLSPPILNAAFSVTFTFSENVVNFTIEDITLINATATDFIKINDLTYTATIIPAANGRVSVAVEAAKAEDVVGNGNLGSTELARIYDAVAPTIVLSTPAANITNVPFPVSFQLSEAVIGFDLADVTITNGAATDFIKTSELGYSAVVTPAIDGEVKLFVAANVVQDSAGNNNVVSNLIALTFDATKPSGYAVVFEQHQIDFTNQMNVTLKVTGAEIGTTYFYTITSENGGTPVTGTGSVEQAQFDITPLNLSGLGGGQLTLTFYLLDAAGNQGENVLVPVTKFSKDIVAVTQPDILKVPIRTTFDQLALPATVEVTYSNGEKEAIPVTWQAGLYNGQVNGQYQITGILTLSPGTTNLNNLPATIIVEVQPNKAPTTITVSTTSFNPDAIPADPITRFITADEDDSQFTYSLVAGAGDTHNNLFTITGDQLFLNSNSGLSGQTQFTIRVKSTDSYNNSIEQSFTLTKSTYAKTPDQLKIVNAFSPNGDGVNDEWTVPELKFYNQVQVEVFDRTGVRLFYTTNPEQGWNGQNLNGQVLPGSYLFIIQVADISLTKKGVVTVLKK